MAVDETELSFIRCPNCRSLVPAIAVRCRMCGFILKEQGAAPPVGFDERPSRVRQRTISVAEDEVEEIQERFTNASKPTNPEQNQEEDEGDIETEEAEEAPVRKSKELARKRMKRRRRRISTTKRPALSAKAIAAKQRELEELEESDDTASHDAGNDDSGHEDVLRHDGGHYDSGREQEVTPRIVSKAAHSRSDLARSDPARSNVSEPFNEPPPIIHPEEEGIIVGWLVSFAEDRKGIAHELRSGRFFIGQVRLRPSDLVIEHATVSTPQCLVVCDERGQVIIQDLMSERGTFISRSGGEFERKSQQVQLRHGDRIKFGDYELLFVLLPAEFK